MWVEWVFFYVYPISVSSVSSSSVSCAFACVKELFCLHHQQHHIWQLSNAFQPFFSYMVNLVVVTTIVLDYLVEATLKGEPGMVDYVSQIIFIHCTACLYQFLFIFQCCIIKLWITLKTPKSSKFVSGELAALFLES